MPLPRVSPTYFYIFFNLMLFIRYNNLIHVSYLFGELYFQFYNAKRSRKVFFFIFLKGSSSSLRLTQLHLVPMMTMKRAPNPDSSSYCYPVKTSLLCHLLESSDLPYLVLILFRRNAIFSSWCDGLVLVPHQVLKIAFNRIKSKVQRKIVMVMIKVR
jgi:hypothetical protein